MGTLVVWFPRSNGGAVCAVSSYTMVYNGILVVWYVYLALLVRRPTFWTEVGSGRVADGIADLRRQGRIVPGPAQPTVHGFEETRCGVACAAQDKP